MLSAVSKPLFKSSVTARKSISFRYSASDELCSLLEDFRLMCNDAIRTAVQNKPKNRFALIELAYPRLKSYGLHTHYIHSACEVAFSVYRNKRRKSIPDIRRAFLKLDNQTYRLSHLLLRIPTTPRNYIFLALQGSDYHLSLVDDPAVKKGSITITTTSVTVAFSKEVEQYEPLGYLGIDTNERNATVSGTDGYYNRFKELGEVVDVKETYRDIRAKMSQMTRGDRRIAKKLCGKYGKRERDRTKSRLNKVSRQVVDYARANNLGIKMEKLKDIRKLYRKGNGQGPDHRARMNTWVFGETLRQVDYKAKWDGVPTHFVNPKGTSSYCPCGSRIVPLGKRQLYCPACDRIWDSDDLASKNIMACAVPQARPFKGSNEEEPRQQEAAGNPRSRWREG